ncbi:MAG: Lrp/AsnC family transcriptional regulator [Nanoarchaeota archaeon]
MKLKKKDLVILASLRKNARESLTTISRKTGIPVSTIFDKLKNNINNLVQRHTSLLNFNEMGYSTRITMTLRVKKNEKEKAREFLLKNRFVNSAYKINNGYDFLIEAIFRNMSEVEAFIEQMESSFKVNEMKIFYIIDEIKREDFMSSPEYLTLTS